MPHTNGRNCFCRIQRDGGQRSMPANSLKSPVYREMINDVALCMIHTTSNGDNAMAICP